MACPFGTHIELNSRKIAFAYKIYVIRINVHLYIVYVKHVGLFI